MATTPLSKPSCIRAGSSPTYFEKAPTPHGVGAFCVPIQRAEYRRECTCILGGMHFGVLLYGVRLRDESLQELLRILFPLGELPT